MPDLFANVFALCCGQNPAHTWILDGFPLPCCHRCTGLYTGACVAIALHAASRPALRAYFMSVHGVFLAALAVFGLHFVPGEGPVLRTVTGILGGFAITTFLCVQPACRWPSASPAATSGRCFPYWLGLIVSVGLLPLAASTDWTGIRWLLSGLSLAGLAALLALAILNLLMGIGFFSPDPRIDAPKDCPNP